MAHNAIETPVINGARRTKSMLVSVGISVTNRGTSFGTAVSLVVRAIVPPLHAHGIDTAPDRHPIVDQAREEHRRDETRDDPETQNHRKPPYRPRTELKEDQTRAERGHVRVDDRR